MLIAIDAGHYLGTPGKRCLKTLDPAETREWTLNSRIAEKVQKQLEQYRCTVLRVDDVTGKRDVSLAERVAAANEAGADVYLSIHHNAGINGGSGGGLVAFSYKEGTVGAAYRDAIYTACMAAGGIQGNRWDATLAEDFYVLRYTTMPAVLMEYGFMDSTTDVPVILTEEYAKAMGYATMEGIAKAAGLTKKTAAPAPAPVTAAPYSGVQVKLQALQKGSNSNQVKAVQRMLYAIGHYNSTIDGQFGSLTESAVKAYQQANGLTADGIVGQKTWNKLLGV